MHLVNFQLRALLTRITNLLNSRNHKTELATATQRNQSPRLKFTVENAC
jgi:hypothetical protein